MKILSDIWNYLCLDNVTTAITVVTFFLTAAQLLHSFFTCRKAITVRVLEFCPRDEAVYFLVSFENNSRLPIAITRIILDVDGGVDCIPISKWIGTNQRSHTEHHNDGSVEKVVEWQNVRYTLSIPISLPGLGAVSGDVWFDVSQSSLPPVPKQLSFLVHTNRGRLRRMTLQLPEATRSHMTSL